MKITMENYVLDVDAEGITAVCRATGERSNITDNDEIVEMLGFELDGDGCLMGELDPHAIEELVKQPVTREKLQQLLDDDRKNGLWHEN